MGGEQNRASDELEAGENKDAQRAREQGKYGGQRDDVSGQRCIPAHRPSHDVTCGCGW